MVRFMEKTLAVAKQSEEILNKLVKLSLDVSARIASIASLFPSVLAALVRVVQDTLSYGGRLHEASLTRISLPAPSLWQRAAAPTVEEFLSPEVQGINASFLLNVTAARIAAAEVAKRVASRAPHPATPEIPSAEAFADAFTGLQRTSEAALTPAVQGITSAFQQYTQRTVIPEVVTHQTLAAAALPSMPVAQLEREVTEVGRLAEELRETALSFQVFGFPTTAPPTTPQVSLPQAMKAEVPPEWLSLPVLSALSRGEGLPSAALERALPPYAIPSLQLQTRVSESIGAAAALPRLTLEPWAPFFRRILAFLSVSPISALTPFKPFPAAVGIGLPVSPPVHTWIGWEGLPSDFFDRLLSKTPFAQFQPEAWRLPTLGYSKPLVDYLRQMTTLGYPSQVDRVTAEFLTPLTMWSQGVPWFTGAPSLKPTPSPILSAMPALPSILQRLIAEAYTPPLPTPLFREWLSPISAFPRAGLEATHALATHVASLLASLGYLGVAAGLWRIGAVSFAPPSAVTPSITEPSQVYPEVSVALEAVTGLTKAAVGKVPSPGEVPGLEKFIVETTLALLGRRLGEKEPWALLSLPLFNALSRGEGLPSIAFVRALPRIAQAPLEIETGGAVWQRVSSLLIGVTGLALRYAPPRDMQVMRSSYGGALAGLGVFPAMRETMVGRVSPVGYEALRAVEPFMPRAMPSKLALPAAQRLPEPTVQNTFNLTVSAESEEDLRDLERKIARILTEQIRRYYGLG